MKRNRRVTITWFDELDDCVEAIVEKHAGSMGESGLLTRVSTRPDGIETGNRSAAIAFALMKLSEMIDEEDAP